MSTERELLQRARDALSRVLIPSPDELTLVPNRWQNARAVLADIDAHLKEPEQDGILNSGPIQETASGVSEPAPAQQDERKALADECHRLWEQALYIVRQGGYCPSRDERNDQEIALAKARSAIARLAAIDAHLSEPEAEVVVTTDLTGRCVAVTRQDEDGRIVKVLWEAQPPTPDPAVIDDRAWPFSKAVGPTQAEPGPESPPGSAPGRD